MAGRLPCWADFLEYRLGKDWRQRPLMAHRRIRHQISGASLAQVSAPTMPPKSLRRRTLALTHVVSNARVCGDQAAETTDVGVGGSRDLGSLNEA